MRIFRDESEPPAFPGAVTTLGIFDGVHLGHQDVLRQAGLWAHELGAPRGIITFAQHPRRVMDGRAPDLLTTLQHRLVLFERAGIDFAWVLEFTRDLSGLSAEVFARRYLVERLRIRGLLLGFDSRFGHDRLGGDSPELPALAQRCGFALRTVPARLAPDGQPISSTRIREAIWDGHLKEAEALLGRRVSVYGRVAHGEALGRRLGYATANLDLGREVRPPFGVYATIAVLEGRSYGSMTNVGYRPTVAKVEVGEKPDLLIETHLFDFLGDLYDRELEVHFVEKLRGERRFPDVATLAGQIRNDEERARAILKAVGI
jgi:riboflavin kinase/FMN adenylyltransferase